MREATDPTDPIDPTGNADIGQPADAAIAGLPLADPAHALAETRAWVDEAVIGLNLCPFAKAVQAKGRVRYALTDAQDADGLREALIDELQRLAAADPAQIETTVLVHPWALTDFLDFNDFLDQADAVLAALGLDGVLQVASFHPDYRFAGEPDEAIGHATNRSPWPTLHLIREDSIARAVAAFPDADTIWQTNLATMERLGAEGWAALQARCRAAARASTG